MPLKESKEVKIPDRCSDCPLNNRCRYDCGTDSCIRRYLRHSNHCKRGGSDVRSD